MTNDQAREYILAHATDHLTRDRSGKGYICPICGSGSGPNGTGITTKDGTHYTCWAGCFSSADIFDIIGQEQGLTEYPDKLRAACSVFGIELDGQPAEHTHTHTHTHKDPRQKKAAPASTNAEPDYSEFILKAAADIDKTDYHRGISRSTLEAYQIGYCESWKHPKAPSAPPSPRLIIPTSKYSYIARDTRAELTDEERKYSKSKVGRTKLFNGRVLTTAERPIFVTEGELDALSIIDAGGEAVGLGSVNNINLLLAALADPRRAPRQPLILALDNDEAGEKATAKLAGELDARGLRYIVARIYGDCKDANELLMKDRAKLAANMADAEREALELRESEIDPALATLESESGIAALTQLRHEIEDGINNGASYIPTGISSLDKALDGGLYAGLYVIGAVSSLGKTTLALQIADNIARQGRPVLFVSLEMAKTEIAAKSLSRITYQENNGGPELPKTTRGIMTGSFYRHYSNAELELITRAYRSYSEYADHITISEGIGNIGVNDIRAKVQAITEKYGEAPTVVIDYLQILAPIDPHYTDKQNVDRSVLALKRLSRDYKTAVIGISSFNRENYKEPANLTSFKESGAVEYSADVLIGLQYDGMDYNDASERPATQQQREREIRKLTADIIDQARAGSFQNIQLKILKNRNGHRGEILLQFYPMFNYFAEPADAADEWETISSTSAAKKAADARPAPAIDPDRLQNDDNAVEELQATFAEITDTLEDTPF